MERNTIENILNFLEEKEGMELPESWFESIEKLKLIKRLENHPDGTQYRYDGDLELSYSNIKDSLLISFIDLHAYTIHDNSGRHLSQPCLIKYFI